MVPNVIFLKFLEKLTHQIIKWTHQGATWEIYKRKSATTLEPECGGGSFCYTINWKGQ